MESLNPIGEIVESSTTCFIAQCLELPRQNEPRLYDPPAFGSFVKIGPPTPAATSIGSSTPSTSPQLGFDDDEPDPFASPAPSLLLASGPISVDTSAFPAAVYALVVGASTTGWGTRRPAAVGR